MFGLEVEIGLGLWAKLGSELRAWGKATSSYITVLAYKNWLFLLFTLSTEL